MKVAAMMIAVLGITVAQNSLAQSAQSNTKPAAQSTPATGQSAGQSTTAGAAQAAPAGKRPPQAKTQAEFDAYKAAAALAEPPDGKPADAAAAEKAANDFATKFPDSELKALLYKSVMHAYQSANNGDKMMEMAQKLLTYDPDDPESLLAVAQVIAERTKDSDLDKEQKLAESRKDAQHALETVDTDIPTVGQAPDRIEAYKAFLRSEAYEIIGTLDYNKQAWADAETNLRKSIDAYPQSVDSVAVLRLSLALDQENKYPEALKYANQAVDLTKEGTVTGDAARKEKDRLTQLTQGAPPAK